MTYLQLEGRRYAIECIENVSGMCKAQFDSRGPLGTVLDNLEQAAKGKPAEYAEGIMSVVRVARESSQR